MKEVSHRYENVSLLRVRGCILAAYFSFFFSLCLSLKFNWFLRYLEAVPCDRTATFLHMCAPLRLSVYSRLSACMRVMKGLSSPGCRGATGMTHCQFFFFPPLILISVELCRFRVRHRLSHPSLPVLFPLPQTLPLSSLSPLLSISRRLLISLPPTSIYHFHFTLLFPPSVLPGQLSRCQSSRQDMNN